MSEQENYTDVRILVLPKEIGADTLSNLVSGPMRWVITKHPTRGITLAIGLGIKTHIKLSELYTGVSAALDYKDYRVKDYISRPFTASELYLDKGIEEIGTIHIGVPYFIHNSDTTVRYIVLEA